MDGKSGRLHAGWIVAAGCCLLFLALGVQFAFTQNLWIDESTQLSGATLGVGRLFAWLAGTREPAFGVPPDRMPPISYLIDAACYRTVCSAPVSWRLLHLLFASGGVAVVTLAVVRRYGIVSGLVTGLLLALSPKATELGVEIRAYPIFFAITCVQIAMLFRLVEAPRLTPKGLGLFLLLGLASAYTHFFGLVASMAMFTGLFAARAASVREALWIAGTALVLGLLCLGLAPFVLTASAISNVENVDGGGLRAFALYFVRLVGHPANVLSNASALLLLLPMVGLAAVATLRIARGFARDGLAYRRDNVVALLVVLASGIAVTLLASLVVKGFNPLKPTYSFWVLPVLAAFLGAACAPDGARPTRIARVLAVLMLLGAASGEAVMVRHGGWFVHGPSSAIRAAVGDDARDTAIVYEGQWGYGFFPTYYYYHDALDQWLLTSDGELQKIGRGGDPQPADSAGLATKRRIIVVRIGLHDYHDLRALRGDGTDRDATVLALPGNQPGFNHLSATTRTTEPGLYWANLATYERTQR